jgi:hypothetical protein
MRGRPIRVATFRANRLCSPSLSKAVSCVTAGIANVRDVAVRASTIAKRLFRERGAVLRGHWHLGHCALCEGATVFLMLGPWLRDEYRCLRCWSIPRQRALAGVLNDTIPGWREARIHEFAPGRNSVEWFQRRCPAYTYSQFWADVRPGNEKAGVRSEDLSRLTFGDNEFDVIITQDVFEHLPDPAAAASEIARVLTPGGAHIFTVPIYPRPTVIRAEVDTQGNIRHLLPSEYHGNPSDPSGSLVFREWGPDIVDFVESVSSLRLRTISPSDRRCGLAGEFLDVFVARKLLGS